MHARMQFSFEWLLIFGSCTSGAPRRTWTVASFSPSRRECWLGFTYCGRDHHRGGADAERRILYGRAWCRG